MDASQAMLIQVCNCIALVFFNCSIFR